MNYAEQLLKERSRSNIDRIAKVIGDDPKEFRKIVDIIYKEKAPLPQFASWLLQVVPKKHPELIKPYITKFINTIETQISPVKRGILDALTGQKIPKTLQSKMLDICFKFIFNPDEEVAIKVYAMEVAGNIVKEHPELAGELKAAIEDQWDKNTVAFRARGRKVLKKLGVITALRVTHDEK